MNSKIFKNVIKHTITVLKHKWIVFKLSIKAGIPFRGLMHDWSKFSKEEFFESVKYYDGSRSPIGICKKKEGYSKAWLHHKGRNKHHQEYWYDYDAPDMTPIIPYKYAVESICDSLSASIIYNGANWTNGKQLEYWNRVKDTSKRMLNPKIREFYTVVYTQVKEQGIKKVITSKNLKKTYNDIVLEK